MLKQSKLVILLLDNNKVIKLDNMEWEKKAIENDLDG